MNILLTDLQYLPSVVFWDKAAQHTAICLEQHENYAKGTARNRCHIASANGVLRLSIPLLQGKNEQQNIKDVRIANDIAWQRQHWRSIASAYGSAPFWAHYEDKFAPFYHKKYDFLWDFNYDLFQTTHRLLKCKNAIITTDSYQKEVAAPHENALENSYEDIRHDKKKTIEIADSPYYPQVFLDKNGFLPNLSIIDRLFCMGY
jgi:hypothetical protein